MSKVEDEIQNDDIIGFEELNLISYPVEYKDAVIASFDSSENAQVKDNISAIVRLAESKQQEMIANANILIKSGEYELAAKLLTEVLKSSSHHHVAIKMLGRCRLGLNDTPGAIQCFKSLVDIEENFASLSMLAEAYYSSGDEGEALEFYVRALESNDVNESMIFDIYKNIGNIFVRNKDLESAEEYYNKAFRINPNSDVLLVNYGTLEVQRSNWDEALDRFRSALRKNISNAKAWVGLALVHREYGDLNLSLGNLHKALDNDPTNSVAIHLFIDWGLKDNRQEEVISRIESFLKHEPENAQYSILLSKLLYMTKRYKSCLEVLGDLTGDVVKSEEVVGIASSAERCLKVVSKEVQL